jgi:hypothetical protein
LFLAQPVFGAEPLMPVESIDSEYLVDTWQTERGLPDNFVNAIAQTPEGYLWVATFNGLARFNGVEFVVFDAANTPELPTSRITNLHCDRKGRLWIISEYGDLAQWAEGRFKAFGAREGLPKPAGCMLSEDAAELAAQAGHLEIATAVENIDGLFSPDAEINLYRIVQEWLTNVVKHSRASKALLLVRKDGAIMRMILEDDGVGFDYDSVMKRATTGFGLANLSERIRLLGGSLKIDTGPGKGTRLSIELPCKT